MSSQTFLFQVDQDGPVACLSGPVKSTKVSKNRANIWQIEYVSFFLFFVFLGYLFGFYGLLFVLNGLLMLGDGSQDIFDIFGTCQISTKW